MRTLRTAAIAVVIAGLAGCGSSTPTPSGGEVAACHSGDGSGAVVEVQGGGERACEEWDQEFSSASDYWHGEVAPAQPHVVCQARHSDLVAVVLTSREPEGAEGEFSERGGEAATSLCGRLAHAGWAMLDGGA